MQWFEAIAPAQHKQTVLNVPAATRSQLTKQKQLLRYVMLQKWIFYMINKGCIGVLEGKGK